MRDGARTEPAPNPRPAFPMSGNPSATPPQPPTTTPPTPPAAAASSFGRFLHRADEGFFRLESGLNLVAALVILAVMLLGVFQVFGRKLINLPVPGYVDVIEFTMGVFAFIAIAYTQRLGGHVRMEIFLKRLRGRTLWVVESAGTIIVIAIMAVLAWFGYEHFLRAWNIGDSTIDIQLPLWPSKLLVPVAFAVLLVRLFIQLGGFLRLAADPGAEPVGIPRIETVDEQARHEIETGLAGEAHGADGADGADGGADGGAREARGEEGKARWTS